MGESGIMDITEIDYEELNVSLKGKYIVTNIRRNSKLFFIPHSEKEKGNFVSKWGAWWVQHGWIIWKV